MQIPALVYFSSWSLTSISFVGLGLMGLDKDKAQISPLVIFLLKRFLAVSVSHSSTYALVHRSKADNTSIINHLKFSAVGFSFLFYAYFVSGPIPLKPILCYNVVVTAFLLLVFKTVDLGFLVDLWVRSIAFSLPVQDDRFFPVFVLVTAFFTAGVAALFNGLSDPNGPNGPEETKSAQNYSKKRKFVGFLGPILASIVLQRLVGFTSLSHIVAFLCFAVAWLGCLALTMARSDLGFFDLLVCNVLIGSVNQFGLTGPTWFAYVASVVLYVLHPIVISVRFLHDSDVVLW